MYAYLIILFLLLESAFHLSSFFLLISEKPSKQHSSQTSEFSHIETLTSKA